MSLVPGGVCFSASANAWNLFFSWRVKVLLALGSFSFIASNCCCLALLGPFLSSFSFRFAVTRWWSLPTSALLLTLTSCNDLLHVPLIIRWTIWFLSLPLGEHQVSLWISRCGKSVPPTTKSYVMQNSSSLSPLLFMRLQPSFPIALSGVTCIVTSHFRIQVAHHYIHLMTWSGRSHGKWGVRSIGNCFFNFYF